MAYRIGKYTIQTEQFPSVLSFASIVGKKEGEGALGKCFDRIGQDDALGEASWEKAESRLQTEVLQLALEKGGYIAEELDFLLAGDLINQCSSSVFGLRSFDIPFLGQFGACSTMAQTIGVASLLIDGNAAVRCAALTSSHFCTAERQFRFPLEYGSTRPPTSQWTVTGTGCLILGKGSRLPKISQIFFGKMVDLGIKDANNMGAAMAPAACQTFLQFFEDTHTSPKDYDVIVTGDLGSIGAKLLTSLLQKEGYDLDCTGQGYYDCGKMIFSGEENVHAGGSGCGCSASVLCGYFLPKLQSGEIRHLLFAATGALMSPTTSQQGESIPGIAHLIHFVGKGAERWSI